MFQQSDGLGGGVSGQRLPSGARREEVRETVNVSTSRGILTEGAASFGCEETINPAVSDPPHGQLNASVVDAFVFWQQLPLADAVIGRLQHPQEQLSPLCPQQHVLPSATPAPAFAGFCGTMGQPMLPTMKTNRVTSAVKRVRSVGRVFTHRRIPESYTRLIQDCKLPVSWLAAEHR